MRPLCRSLSSRGHLVTYSAAESERGARLSRPKFRTWHREMRTRRVSQGTPGTGSPDPTRNADVRVPFWDLKLRLFGTGATPKAEETLFGWRHGKFLSPESLKSGVNRGSGGSATQRAILRNREACSLPPPSPPSSSSERRPLEAKLEGENGGFWGRDSPPLLDPAPAPNLDTKRGAVRGDLREETTVTLLATLFACNSCSVRCCSAVCQGSRRRQPLIWLLSKLL